jgi:hypothetical protein
MTDGPPSWLDSETELPALVRRYLERVLPPEADVPGQVRVMQVGEMRQKLGGRWLRFSAVEEFAVEEFGFASRATGVGGYGDYGIVGGVRIPTRAEVRWELADGPFTYWRGRITSLELDPAVPLPSS